MAHWCEDCRGSTGSGSPCSDECEDCSCEEGATCECDCHDDHEPDCDDFDRDDSIWDGDWL